MQRTLISYNLFVNKVSFIECNIKCSIQQFSELNVTRRVDFIVKLRSEH